MARKCKVNDTIKKRHFRLRKHSFQDPASLNQRGRSVTAHLSDTVTELHSGRIRVALTTPSM